MQSFYTKTCKLFVQIFNEKKDLQLRSNCKMQATTKTIQKKTELMAEMHKSSYLQ